MTEKVFTQEIEVLKKDKNKNFIFEEIKLFHKDCMGGEIEVDGEYGISLSCKRCDEEIIGITSSSSFKSKEIVLSLKKSIIRTAIDGQKREVECSRNPSSEKIKIIVTQRA